MRCAECNAEKANVRVYNTGFDFSYNDQQIFRIGFNKVLCKQCLEANINELTEEVKFLLSEDGKGTEGLQLFLDKEYLAKL